MYDGSGQTVFKSRYKEDPLHEDDPDPDFVDAFLGYTPAGNVGIPQGAWSKIQHHSDFDVFNSVFIYFLYSQCKYFHQS